MSIENLPREIILEIISRLPTSSLFNIKLVSQSWRKLAQDPHLINLQISQNNPPCLILHNDYPIVNQLHTLYLYPNNYQHGILKKIPVPNMPEFDVIGFSNDWLCLFSSLNKNPFHLYNPFSNSCIELPKSNHVIDIWTAFGFGFDNFKKEYKILTISPIRRGSISDVQILTVGSSLEWRNLGEISYYPIQSPSQVVLNGKLHWVDWPRRHKPGRLVFSFDLKEEKFKRVPAPNFGGGFMLMVLRGCLCAAVDGNYASFQVWVMKEYGVRESWSQEFCVGVYLPKQLELDIDPSFKVSKFYKRSFTRILCGLINGEILIEYKRRALVVYDPKSGIFKDVQILGLPNWFEATFNSSGSR